MILRRLSEHLKAQNWTAVALEFIVDLEADTATARRGVARADDGDRHAETLLALIETGAAAGTGDPDLIRAVLVAGYVYLPRATRGTYDELISTGHLRLIRDEGLKRDLSRCYERMESARQWDDLVRVEQSAYRAAVRGLLNRQQLIWARQAAGGGLDPASAPPLDRDGLIAGARVRPDLPGALAAGLEGELMLLRRLSHHFKTQHWTA